MTDPPRPVLGKVWAHGRAVLLWFVRDEGGVYAAAIAFYMLVSLVPLCSLLVGVGGGMLVLLGPAEAGGMDALLGDVVAVVHRYLPLVTEADARDALDSVIRNRGNFGLLGTLGLMLAASQVVGVTRVAVARIVGPGTREATPHLATSGFQRFAQRLVPVWNRLKTFFWLGFLGVLVGVLKLVSVSARSWLAPLGPVPLAHLLEAPWVQFLLSRAVGLALTFLGFVVVIVHVARRATTWTGRLWGAATFSVLQAVAEMAFAWWVSQYASLSVRYGSLANLVALGTWVFYSACVFLLCVQLTAVVSHPKRLYPEEPPTPPPG